MSEVYVVFDIETTGSHVRDDRIIEIGAVKIKDGIEIEVFDELIDPKREIGEFITNLTGITNYDVLNKPTADIILQKFVEFISDAKYLVGHNIKHFDFPFLKEQCDEFGVEIKDEYRLVDTLDLARIALKNSEVRNHKLNTLCWYFDIELDHHRGLNDARATYLVYENHLKPYKDKLRELKYHKQYIEISEDMLSEDDFKLFDKLKEYRTNTLEKIHENGKKHLSEYHIFDDKTMYLITTHKPVTKTGLLHIYGIGKGKADLYGNDIIKITKNHLIDINSKYNDINNETKDKLKEILINKQFYFDDIFLQSFNHHRNTFERGSFLYQSNTMVKLSSYNDEEEKISFEIIGMKDTYKIDIIFDEGFAYIKDSSCSCVAFQRFNNECKHIIAILHLLNNVSDELKKEIKPVHLKGLRLYIENQI